MAKRTNNVWGVGINDYGLYKSRIKGIHTKEYKTWICMLQRCYDPKLHKRNITYKDCRVCPEWLSFQNFGKWFTDNYKEGCQLDKDILIKGNKIYSPETCAFVPKEINLLIIRPVKKSNKNVFPIGIQKWRKGFRVKLRINNKQSHIGCYDTIEEAFSIYKSEKESHIKTMADKYKNVIDIRIYNALLNYTIEK